MSEDTVKELHYERQFLAPKRTRYDRCFCQSYVYVGTTPEDIALETELIISDGNDIIDFDFAHWDDQYDQYLAAITKLMEQIIAYRQAYAEALAIMRGQSVSVGATATVAWDSETKLEG